MEKLHGLAPNLQSFYKDLSARFPNAYITSGRRTASQGIGKASKTSRHNTGQAMDLRHDPKIVNYFGSQEGAGLLAKYGLGFLDEGSPEMLKKTGGTGAHIHVGMDTKLAAEAKVLAGGQPQTQLAQQLLPPPTPKPAASTAPTAPAPMDLASVLYAGAQQKDMRPVDDYVQQGADTFGYAPQGGVDYTKYFG